MNEKKPQTKAPAKPGTAPEKKPLTTAKPVDPKAKPQAPKPKM